MTYDDLINELLEILHVVTHDGFWSDTEAVEDTLRRAGVSEERIERMKRLYDEGVNAGQRALDTRLPPIEQLEGRTPMWCPRLHEFTATYDEIDEGEDRCPVCGLHGHTNKADAEQEADDMFSG